MKLHYNETRKEGGIKGKSNLFQVRVELGHFKIQRQGEGVYVNGMKG
jgi:hypothetical protein